MAVNGEMVSGKDAIAAPAQPAAAQVSSAHAQLSFDSELHIVISLVWSAHCVPLMFAGEPR